MRIIIALVCCLSLLSTVACAEEKTFTGSEYLKLTQKQKIALVSKMINEAGTKGIAIQQSPQFYCEKLATFYAKAPAMMVSEPFATVLKTLMIMEYDWDQAGVNKDELAKKTLDEATYRSNKDRLKNK